MVVDWLLANKAQLQHGAFALLFLLAALRGAAPERLLAGVLLSMPVLDRAYHMMAGGSYLLGETNLGHLFIDILVAAVLYTIALSANRVYPIWMMSAQLIALSAHVYRATVEQINQFAYDAMQVTPSYIQLVAMALGLGYHMSRRRKRGNYRSWRKFFSPGPDRQQLGSHNA